MLLVCPGGPLGPIFSSLITSEIQRRNSSSVVIQRNTSGAERLMVISSSKYPRSPRRAANHSTTQARITNTSKIFRARTRKPIHPSVSSGSFAESDDIPATPVLLVKLLPLFHVHRPSTATNAHSPASRGASSLNANQQSFKRAFRCHVFFAHNLSR